MDAKKKGKDKTTDRLDDTARIAFDTEQIGAEVLSKLHKQRQQLETANKDLDDIESNMDAANRHLGKMGRRVVYNKLVLMFAIFMLVLLNASVIYLRWFADDSVIFA